MLKLLRIIFWLIRFVSCGRNFSQISVFVLGGKSEVSVVLEPFALR